MDLINYSWCSEQIPVFTGTVGADKFKLFVPADKIAYPYSRGEIHSVHLEITAHDGIKSEG